MTPLERAARVLCEFDGGDPDEVRHGEGRAWGRAWLGWQAYASQARRVIEAIREPSEAMENAGTVQADRTAVVGPIWCAMVDALLNEDNAGR